MTQNDEQQFFLGVDGGGSKCKAIVMSMNNKILGSGISGPANPSNGFELTVSSIVESAGLALKDAGLENVKLSDLVAGVGLAGMNLPSLFTQMSDWQHPFKDMYLSTDLLIACLGAHQGKDGAVIIIGTGSCGFSHVNNQQFIVGGHGFPQGDKGAGAWFGLEAVKHVLLSLDGIIGTSSMNIPLLKCLKVSNSVELIEVTAGKPASFYAQLANIVFTATDNGDEIAMKLVKDGAKYISDVARLLVQRNTMPMSLVGGIAPLLFSWLDADIQEQLSKPLASPEEGAVFFAKQQSTLLSQQC
ncbi:BadF/BadG/BcrA/BcrD ATPase family protein [Paraglaciecola sp.]|uniref:N-acetylglucosamine kinase n=1 Tax=Paraglaciecola sp. TaxID=1920173 RepID=UPI003264C2B0